MRAGNGGAITAVAVLGLAVGGATADVLEWIGTQSNPNWSASQNWSPAGPPGATDTAQLTDNGYFELDLGSGVYTPDLLIDAAQSYRIYGGEMTFEQIRLTVSGGFPAHVIDAPLRTAGAGVIEVPENLFLFADDALDTRNVPLRKTGGGTLGLRASTESTHRRMIIDEGVVIFGEAGVFSDTGRLRVNALGTLRLTEDETIGGLLGDGRVELNANRLSLATEENLTFDGDISGPDRSEMHMIGAGSQTFTGSLGFDKIAVSQSSCTLHGADAQLRGSNAPLLANGAVLTISGGSTVTLPDLGSGDDQAGNLDVRGGADVTLTGAGTTVLGSRTDLIGVGSPASMTVEQDARLIMRLGVDPLVVVGANTTGQGLGRLTVQDGGLVDCGFLYVGLDEQDDGQVNVTGRGSLVACDQLRMGGTSFAQQGGAATLTVSHQAEVVVAGRLSNRTDSGNITVDGGRLIVDELDMVTGRPITLSDPNDGAALTIGILDGSSTIASRISGPGTIEKRGQGTLTIARALETEGGILVADGVLVLDRSISGNVSLTGTGDVVLKGGTALHGDGFVGGRLVVETGAGIQPAGGADTSASIRAGRLELQPGSTVDLKLDGSSVLHELIVSGEAQLAGTLQLSYRTGATAASGTRFVLMQAGSFRGAFANVIPPDGQNWVIYQAGGNLLAEICDGSSSCLELCAGEIGTFAPASTDMFGTARNGSVVAAAAGSNGIYVFDAADTALNAPRSTINTPVTNVAGGRGIALDERYLYVAGNNLLIYDLDDPNTPTLASLTNSGLAFDVAIEGDLLAVAGFNGLFLYDVSDRTSPALLGSLSKSGASGAGHVTFHNGLLYYAWSSDFSFNGELVIVDVSNPAAPDELAAVATSSLSSEPVFRGEVAFVGNITGVRSIDVSDPNNPTDLDQLTYGDFVSGGGVAIQGDALYQADAAGIRVLDVSDPANLVQTDLLSSYTTFSVEIFDGVMYAARARDGLTTLNFLDSDADEVLDSCDVCIGDDASGDSDEDGVCDDLDNCPLFINPAQLDSDAPDPSLAAVAAWHFDEGAGSTANDVVGGNTALLNTAGWNSAGWRGAAMEFPTGAGPATVSSSADFEITDHLTISMWVKPTAYQNNVNRLLTRAGGVYVLRLVGQTPLFIVRKNGGLVVARADFAVPLNEWTHLTAVWDGLGDGLLRIYINGADAPAYFGQGTAAAPIDSAVGGVTFSSGGERFVGLMDEVAIFNRALTPTEIESVYLRGIGDGIGDACDACLGNNATGDSDGDGICDDLDACSGFDDGTDSDNDGVADGCDACLGDDASGDTDGDGICDDIDACPTQDDSLDADGDGVPDGCDVCPGFDDNLDTDGDGVADGCDIEVTIDFDGVPTASETYSEDGFTVTPVGASFEFDDTGNPAPSLLCSQAFRVEAADGGPFDLVRFEAQTFGLFPNSWRVRGTRADGSTIEQVVDIVGSSLFQQYALTGFADVMQVTITRLPNQLQTDVRFDNLVVRQRSYGDCNGDGQLDTGPDGDGDGVADTCDACPGFDDMVDADGDFIPDGCDTCTGSDATGDSDADGVCNDLDACPGSDDSLDADADGVPDGCDVCPGFDDAIDSDGNGIPDGCDATACLGDTDGDNDVDLSDLALLLSQFGQTGNDLAGDVDEDGDVDLSDLATVLGQFGQNC